MTRRDPVLGQIHRSTVESVARIIGPHSAAQRALDAAEQYEYPIFWRDLENDAIVVIDMPAPRAYKGEPE
jgi:hypothetical protein